MDMGSAFEVPHDALVGGRFVPAQSGARMQVSNPANGALLANVAACGQADIDDAVKAARQAFNGSWSHLAPTERGKLLRKVAELIRSNAPELALLDTRDAGRPIRDTTNDLIRAADIFDFFGGLCDKLRGATLPVPPGFIARTVREPYGVVGAIVPWNIPLVMACLKIAPALAAGNTLILKPADETPLSALALGRLCLEAGIPEGVVNIVPGEGETAGAALVSHPGVDKIAFTGSTQTGRLIMQAAAGSMKGLTLELGGKAPNIIFADADLDRAVQGALFTAFHHQGQICAAGSRLLVEATIAEEFTQRLVMAARRIRVGDPEDPDTHVGAVISPRQMATVERYVASGLQEGALLSTGGMRVTEGLPQGGLYYQPTVFNSVRPSMAIAREEIFGPVLSVLSFADEAEAVKLANDTAYGLTAAIWTRNADRAGRLPGQVRAGTVWVNTTNVMNVAVPAGGFGLSGFGKEYGLEGAEGYTRLKTVWQDTTGRPLGWGI
jgi:acyl-CoA reductase-like NAD-dependent aldehyde dehydrogenase